MELAIPVPLQDVVLIPKNDRKDEKRREAYECKLCTCTPLDPVCLAPCSHGPFCSACYCQINKTKPNKPNTCPVCKQETKGKLHDESAFHSLWGLDVDVECAAPDCAWTGKMDEEAATRSHVGTCQLLKIHKQKSTIETLNRKLAEVLPLEEENPKLKNRIRLLEQSLGNAQHNLSSLNTDLKKARTECAQMKQKISSLEEEAEQQAASHAKALSEKQLQVANAEEKLKASEQQKEKWRTTLQKTQSQLENTRKELGASMQQAETRKSACDDASAVIEDQLRQELQERDEEIADLKRRLLLKDKNSTCSTPARTKQSMASDSSSEDDKPTAQPAKRKRDQMNADSSKREDNDSTADQQEPSCRVKTSHSKADVVENHGLFTAVADCFGDGSENDQIATWQQLPSEVMVNVDASGFPGISGKYTLQGLGVDNSAKYSMQGVWTHTTATYQISRAETGNRNWFLSVRGADEDENSPRKNLYYTLAGGEYKCIPPTNAWRCVTHSGLPQMTPPTLKYPRV